MKESAGNLYNLLENLLQCSRMQQGLLKIEPGEFNLKEEVLYSLESFQINAKNKMIGLSYEIADDIKVFADNKMFNTITRNLFTNAVKFTPKGGRITISAQYSADNNVVICFRDTGIGMSPGRKNNLFRLDVKTSRPGTEGELSTGLGLILVREFIEMHGGSIWVESEENKGSRFFIGLKKSALTCDT